MNELWELVDINGIKTGVMIERGTNTPIPQGMYHVAVDIWTKSKDGKILLTQRHPNKEWGLKWECSGGAMAAGESPIDCARRELEEETGIQVSEEKLTYLGKTIMSGYQCIMYTYLVVLADDVELKLQPEEVVDAKWVDSIELENMQQEIVESVWDRYLQFKNLIIEYLSEELKMHYRIERYKNCKRFNDQYQDIYSFLLKAEKIEYNEHFHWARFEWMQIHTFLDEDKLTNIVMFRDENDEIVGMITYDTCYDDRVYLLHTTSDKTLLNKMVDIIIENESDEAVIKVNSKDEVLAEVLQERQFEKTERDNTVLELDLSESLEYEVSDEYSISPQEFIMDDWQYQLVIHKGFENEGIPDKWDDEVLTWGVNINPKLRTFAIMNDEYCAHCGLWYTEGDSAYVEPVVTIPDHRKKGLAKAVIYEACNRAKNLGAKRATVISDQDFYYKIGFKCSSEVFCWKKNI